MNANDRDSVAIGEFYRRERDLPADRVVALDTETSRTISRATYRSEIRDVLEQALVERGEVDAVHQIVVVRGVPLRVVTEHPDGTRWLDGTESSVDAELALLFSGLDGRHAFREAIPNPYYDADVPFRAFRDAHPASPLRYLVARIDGYDRRRNDEVARGDVPPDIAALIERACAPGIPAAWVVDEDPAQLAGRVWANEALLAPAVSRLQALGVSVLHDRTSAFVSGVDAVAGYASWGSNDSHAPAPPTYDAATPGRFAPRAIAVDFVSTNARSFAWPPEYGQSLTADLLALGAAGAAGHVFEPTLGRVARPEVLLPRFASGVPAGEAFFRSLTHLGDVNVYLGDPLMTCDPRVPSVCAVPEPRARAAAIAVLTTVGALARRRGRRPATSPG